MTDNKNREIIYEATFPYEMSSEGVVPKFPFRRTYIVHTDDESCLGINFDSLFQVVKRFPNAYRWKLTTREGNKILEECLIYMKKGGILRETPYIRQVAFAENGTPERRHTLEWEIDTEIYYRQKD